MIGQRRLCTIRLNGHDQEISFLERTGEEQKTPFLFLHGWGGNAESWQALWNELCMRRHTLPRFLALDLPGFGLSREPQRAWTLEDFAQSIIHILDALQIKKVNIVCHSFGGRVAIMLAYHQPDRIKKVVALAPAGIVHHRRLKRLLAFFAHAGTIFFRLPFLRRAFPFVRRVLHRFFGNPEYTDVHDVMQQIYQQAITRDCRPLLPTMPQPFLICWGRHDTYLPVRDAALLQRLLPNAQAHIFEDGRHGIHVTHAQEIASLMIPLFDC